MNAPRLAALGAAAALAVGALVTPALAISNIWHSANAACYTNPPLDELEFENPLTGGERIMGHSILEWRDADYKKGNPPWYDDWTVYPQGGVIDGCDTEIWMRMGTQWIATDTTVASTIVAINLPADDNDGLARVYVDGQAVFSADMGSRQRERVIILVNDLPNTTHHIEVHDEGWGPFGTDVHCFGAAALAESEIKWEQPPEPIQPTNVFFGWNLASSPSAYHVASDDWKCTTTEPVTDIHWWGSFVGWKHARLPDIQPDHFHITIWSDVPRGVGEPFSHPGECVWEYDAYNLEPTFAGWDYGSYQPYQEEFEACFRWDLNLPHSSWFYQQNEPPNNIYWLAIEAVYAPCACLPDMNCDGVVDSGDVDPFYLAMNDPDQYRATYPNCNIMNGDDDCDGDIDSDDLAILMCMIEGGTQCCQSDISYPWGWKTRLQQPDSTAPDMAVTISNPLYPHPGDSYVSGMPVAGPDPTVFWDLAFELTTRTMTHKWDQRPAQEWPGLHAHDYTDASGNYSWVTLADDWQCTGGLVTDLHWWGNYETDDSGREMRGLGINHFHLSIHDNVPGPPFSQPGPEVWGMDVPFSQVSERWAGFSNNEGCKVYEYFYVLPEPFPQLARNIYWLDITAYSNDPQFPNYAIWRWQESGRTNPPRLDGAVESGTYYPWSPIYWPELEAYSEMAFAVTSGTPPTPKWSQPPMPYQMTNAYNGWNEKSVRESDQIVADDWVCLTDGPVTDIHWWGSYLGWSDPTLPERPPDAFDIAIWSDIPPNGAGYSHPGMVLWEENFDYYTWQFVGWDIDPRGESAPEACFKFDVDLPKDRWFHQEDYGLGNIFWLSIAAVYYYTPSDYPWGWKTRPRYPDSQAPDDAVRIFDPTAPVLYDLFSRGEPIWWPVRERPWDMAFTLTTCRAEPGSLTFARNIPIPDHLWRPNPNDPYNEMISMTASADANEAVSWDTVTLQAFGRGNDQTDIASVDVWIDNNDDGIVDPGDTWIGTGAYPADNGAVTISIANPPLPPGAPVIIPAGGGINVLISYTMSPLAAPGATYRFDVVAASGTGQTTGLAVPVFGLPLSSARKVVDGLVPITIGEAKKLPVGVPFLLQDKVVSADFRPIYAMDGFYIEEETRASGIGVWPTFNAPPILVPGQRITLIGTCYLLNGAELVVDPDYIAPPVGGNEVLPVGMSNKWSGGGQFGGQPAVMDNGQLPGPFRPTCGLSNVGMLVRTWGRVTGFGQIDIAGGLGSFFNVFWINDGSDLRDGFVTFAGEPSLGVCVIRLPEMPDFGYLGITGIMRAIPNPFGPPVRLLVPRRQDDVTPYPED